MSIDKFSELLIFRAKKETLLDFEKSRQHNADMKTNHPCVYILRCKDGTLYTGWTNDFEKRLAAHNSGRGAKYTKGRGPVTPVYLEYLPDRETALRREATIKKLPLKKKQQLIASETNRLPR